MIWISKVSKKCGRKKYTTSARWKSRSVHHFIPGCICWVLLLLHECYVVFLAPIVCILCTLQFLQILSLIQRIKNTGVTCGDILSFKVCFNEELCSVAQILLSVAPQLPVMSTKGSAHIVNVLFTLHLAVFSGREIKTTGGSISRCSMVCSHSIWCVIHFYLYYIASSTTSSSIWEFDYSSSKSWYVHIMPTMHPAVLLMWACMLEYLAIIIYVYYHYAGYLLQH